MENNILNMEHLSDSDKAKITYEKYRQDAEKLYLTAVKRWKKHLFIYVVLFIVCLIATYLFALNIFGFMIFLWEDLPLFSAALPVRRPIVICVWKSNPISSVCAAQSNELTEWDFILSCRKKTIINLIVGGIDVP